MKKIALVTLMLAIVGGFSGSAYAEITEAWGKTVYVYADPNDVVVALDKKGACGSGYFHIQRTNANFKELTAVVLTAHATGKMVHLYVASCSGDRNILSHGAIFQ